MSNDLLQVMKVAPHMSWTLIISDKYPARAGLLPVGFSAPALAAEVFMDSEAFAAFYGRTARPLWAYLARVSANPALADDLMQESFVRYLSADNPPASAEGEIAARRYLFRIASNLLKDHWRRPSSQHANELPIHELPEELFVAPALSDSSALLGQALAQLRPRDRELLWLAHAEGYGHREIAKITGLSTASIGLLMFRARRKLTALLTTDARGVDRSAVKTQTSLRRQP